MQHLYDIQVCHVISKVVKISRTQTVSDFFCEKCQMEILRFEEYTAVLCVVFLLDVIFFRIEKSLFTSCKINTWTSFGVIYVASCLFFVHKKKTSIYVSNFTETCIARIMQVLAVMPVMLADYWSYLNSLVFISLALT